MFRASSHHGANRTCLNMLSDDESKPCGWISHAASMMPDPKPHAPRPYRASKSGLSISGMGLSYHPRGHIGSQILKTVAGRAYSSMKITAGPDVSASTYEASSVMVAVL